jgi:DamX protein
VLYDLGRGVEPDVATAMQWYERAAEGGYHPAASRLAALRAANPSIPSTLPAPSPASASPPTTASGAEPPAAQTSQGAAAQVATPGAEPPGMAMATPREAQTSAAVGSSANPWLAELDPTHYTLQLLSHTDEASVRRYLEEHFADGSARYFAFELEGKTWYSVVYGDYASHSQAKAAGEALAGRLSGPQPWVRKVAIIQKAAIR